MFSLYELHGFRNNSKKVIGEHVEIYVNPEDYYDAFCAEDSRAVSVFLFALDALFF